MESQRQQPEPPETQHLVSFTVLAHFHHGRFTVLRQSHHGANHFSPRDRTAISRCQPEQQSREHYGRGIQSYELHDSLFIEPLHGADPSSSPLNHVSRLCTWQVRRWPLPAVKWLTATSSWQMSTRRCWTAAKHPVTSTDSNLALASRECVTLTQHVSVTSTSSSIQKQVRR